MKCTVKGNQNNGHIIQVIALIEEVTKAGLTVWHMMFMWPNKHPVTYLSLYTDCYRSCNLYFLWSLSSVFSYNTVAWIGTRIWYTLTILTEQSSPVNLNTCMTKNGLPNELVL